ncbi:MAG: hypothetical protein IJV27_09890 [Prevotella sp.]|nr:hypothetical protein [Prevotella sp.]
MKKLIVIMVLLCSICNIHAQEVFKEIYDSSYKTFADAKEDVEVRKIASFKVAALTYLNTKTLEILNDSTHELNAKLMAQLMAKRDSQAYFMYDYINLFTKEYTRVSKKADKDRVLKMFRDASINNPLYNDADREFVLAYFNREDFLTQFSLDTDWVKANADIRRKLRGE